MILLSLSLSQLSPVTFESDCMFLSCEIFFIIFVVVNFRCGWQNITRDNDIAMDFFVLVPLLFFGLMW